MLARIDSESSRGAEPNRSENVVRKFGYLAMPIMPMSSVIAKRIGTDHLASLLELIMPGSGTMRALQKFARSEFPPIGFLLCRWRRSR